MPRRKSSHIDDPAAVAQRLKEASAHARPAALAGLGQIAFRHGEPRRAIKLLGEALSGFGAAIAEHASLGDTLGRAYASVGELSSAIAIFQRFLDSAEERGDF